LEEITQQILEEFIHKTDILLKPTQHKLCIPIINRIYHKMKYGIQFPPIKVCDQLIIDGHHRYISSLLADNIIEQIPSLKSISTFSKQWKELTFDNSDWDTTSKIDYLNRQDAEHNNISIQIVEKISTNKF
jgi:hypothetical protein